MLCIATPSSVNPVDNQTIYLPLDVEISAQMKPNNQTSETCIAYRDRLFPDTIGQIGMKNRVITMQGAQVGITTRREQD